MADTRQIILVLLLGSYDLQTRKYLDDIKEVIAMNFSGENIYSFMLENVELYFSETLQVLVESTNDHKATLFIFKEHQTLEDVFDVNVKGDLNDTIYDFLKQKYEVAQMKRQPMFEKFGHMMNLAKILFIIRDKEETRGGEYVELMHALFEGHSDKIRFLRRDGVRLSSMLMEYLDKFEINIRPYSDYSELKEEIIRLLRHSLSSGRS